MELSGDVADKPRVCASAPRRDVDSFVRNVINHYLDDWREPCESLAQFDRTGESYDAEPVLAEFQAAVAAGAARAPYAPRAA